MSRYRQKWKPQPLRNHTAAHPLALRVSFACSVPVSLCVAIPFPFGVSLPLAVPVSLCVAVAFSVPVSLCVAVPFPFGVSLPLAVRQPLDEPHHMRKHHSQHLGVHCRDTEARLGGKVQLHPQHHRVHAAEQMPPLLPVSRGGPGPSRRLLQRQRRPGDTLCTI